MPRILDSLPELYQKLFPDFFGLEIPEETKATCHSCAMCKESCGNSVAAEDAIDGRSRFYWPDTKCCTYYPTIPNYLVGAILSDPDPALAEGKRRIEEKIRSRAGVSPLSLQTPARFHLLYKRTDDFFGKSPSLLCPYYEKVKGQCTIWRHRDAVCSTFFCKHEAGADGKKFWNHLKAYLALTEIQLSRYCVLELYPEFIEAEKHRSDGPGDRLTLEELEGLPPLESTYQALWKQWQEKEAEFYRACYKTVQAIEPSRFESILGLDATLWRRLLEKSRQAIVEPRLPKRLKLNPATTVKKLSDGSIALAAYSETEALALPQLAYSLLLEFTGKEPVEQVRERIRTKHSTDLGEELLLALYQQRVLIE